MTVTLTVPTGTVTSELMFFKPPEDGSQAYQYVEEPPAGIPKMNYGTQGHLVTLSDLRGKESEFNLDTNAFQVIRGVESAETEFNDDEHIKRVYYPEVVKLLLDNVPGAYRVFLFDHTIRRPDAARTPVFIAHIDQTAKSAATRVQQHVPEDAEKLLQGRYRIINVWRPINGTVYTDPLGLADSSTVVDDDVLAVKHITPNRNGETAGVIYNADQRWHYLSGMTNNERLLIKCFDSDDQVGKWGRAPHTAFKDPRSPPEAPRRESIEVRALVFG